jgi:hypothetical protein
MRGYGINLVGDPTVATDHVGLEILDEKGIPPS